MDNASLYSRSQEMQQRDNRAGLLKCLPDMFWEEDEAVLDVGCGPGDYFRAGFFAVGHFPVKKKMLVSVRLR